MKIITTILLLLASTHTFSMDNAGIEKLKATPATQFDIAEIRLHFIIAKLSRDLLLLDRYDRKWSFKNFEVIIKEYDSFADEDTFYLISRFAARSKDVTEQNCQTVKSYMQSKIPTEAISNSIFPKETPDTGSLLFHTVRLTAKENSAFTITC